jgi:hypothetical protein
MELTREALAGALIFILVISVFVYWAISRSRRRPSISSPKTEMPGGGTVREKEHDEPHSSPETLTSFLQLIDPAGYARPITKLPASIGRDDNNDVVLKEETVSARHARLYYDNALGLCIEDIDSLNGLYIDGRPTRKNVLHDNMKITVGNVTLTFRDMGYIHPGV